MLQRLLIICFALVSMTSTAIQKSDFEKAYNACIQINTAFEDGYAHSEQLSNAASILRKLKIGALQIRQIKGDLHSLNGHIVFTPNFILDCIDNNSIYAMADEYAKKQSSYRSGDILMTTVLVKAGCSAQYKISNCHDRVDIGCIAEPNGLFSWVLKVEDAKTHRIIETIKDNIDEVKGRMSRQERIEGIHYNIIIEITNTSTFDSSFAIIAQ